MKKDGLGTRMKSYESFETERRLMKFLPIYARLDGIAFHTFCRKLKRPYDERLSSLMIQLTQELAHLFNANCAYTQSDEISLAWYIEDYQSEMLLDGKVQKLNSHLASKTSVKFNKFLPEFIPEKTQDAYFDCRIFTFPNLTEAANMFLWRELDAARNSVQMAGQAYFSHKQLHKKRSSEIQEMLFSQHKINWNDYPSFFKRGTFIIRKRVSVLPEMDKIPEKYRKSTNPDLPIERNEYVQYDMPAFSKVTNRERVLFYGEEPVLALTNPVAPV